MAQYITGTASGPNAVDDLILQIRTALLANGWTEHDVISSSVGSRDIVFKSVAIDTTAGNSSFVRISQTVVGQFWWRTYRDWDATAHAGMNEAGASNLSHSSPGETTFNFLMRVNEYAVAIVCKSGANYIRSYAGFLRRCLPYNQSGITKSTSAYAVGVSTMAVASDMTTRIRAGQRVHIINYAHNSASANKSNAEVLTVQSVTAGSITFTSPTTKAYDIGAIIGENPMPSIVGGNSTTTWNNFYAHMFLDGTYTGVTSQAMQVETVLPTESNTDPGDIDLRYAAGWQFAYSATSTKTGLYGMFYHYWACSAGSQVNEDVMDDGTSTFVVLTCSTSGNAMLGPR